MTTVFHIVSASDWDTALIGGSYAPESLATEGFVHLSYAAQVAATANRYYRELDDLVVVELEPALLEGDLRAEDLTGRGEAFPHLYGPVPTTAAVALHPLPRDDAGDYTFTV
jgi:uncharacterized protein (DUF952 family)